MLGVLEAKVQSLISKKYQVTCPSPGMHEGLTCDCAQLAPKPRLRQDQIVTRLPSWSLYFMPTKTKSLSRSSPSFANVCFVELKSMSVPSIFNNISFSRTL